MNIKRTMERWEEFLQKYQRDYLENLEIAVQRGKKKFAGRDFFIMVIKRKDNLGVGEILTYFTDVDQWFVTQSCPDPDFSQSVYKYDAAADKHEILWSLPEEEIAKELRHALTPPEGYEAAFDVVKKYYEGVLWKLCKFYNKEQKDTNLLEGKDPIKYKEYIGALDELDKNIDELPDLKKILKV